jgi:hypothetical protein
MNAGMLWFDKSKNTPALAKIENAYNYYLKKYGRKPTLVLVHPSMIEPGLMLSINGAEIHTYRPVLPGHIWVGMADEGEAAK